MQIYKTNWSVFRTTALILTVIMFFACSTPLKEITYMYNVQTDVSFVNDTLPEIYTIRSGDQLFIQVIGDDPLTTAFLNLVPAERMYSTYQSEELITFIVDEEGKIYYPQIGEIKISGLTVSEVREILQKKVDNYLQNASVFVKLVNRTVTVLGEVRQPGQHRMVKNQLNIFEALGVAGDITDYGNRHNIKLIRETSGGKVVSSIDLTDPQLIASPNYYIMPHDVIYVEPSDKVYGSKTRPYATSTSIIFSIISTALLIFNIFK